MSKRLYVSDMDGTLLGSDAMLSERTVELLGEALDAGAAFTVATARTPATVDVLLGRLRSRLSLPAIVMTGAALWDMKRRRYIDPQFIPADYTTLIDRAMAEAGVTPFVYALPDAGGLLDVYHAETRLSRVEERFVDERRGLALKRFHIGRRPGEATRRATMLYFGMGPSERTRAAARLIEATTGCAVSDYFDTYDRETGLIEVFAPGVSKAAAVRAMAARIGASGVTVFGDNLNDLAMFGAADCAVAVANALPAVRAAADETIGANVTDAVARYVRDGM